MNQNRNRRIFVVGNEKGGAGKTTCSMHLIVGLLDKGYRVSSIDVDSRQHSLTTYINHREAYNKKNQDKPVDMPKHYHLQESSNNSLYEKSSEELSFFEETLKQAKDSADYVVIDTPGSHTNLSRIAHSYADVIITPVNDSFVDLDVMAKIDDENLTSLNLPFTAK